MAHFRLAFGMFILSLASIHSACADVKVISPTGVLPNITTDPTTDGITNSLARLIQQFIGITIVLGVIAIIYAGIKLVLSIGDAGKMKKARDIVIYALIGTLLAVSAYGIVSFVANLELT